jgi:hypothetical protein
LPLKFIFFIFASLLSATNFFYFHQLYLKLPKFASSYFCQTEKVAENSINLFSAAFFNAAKNNNFPGIQNDMISNYN